MRWFKTWYAGTDSVDRTSLFPPLLIGDFERFCSEIRECLCLFETEVGLFVFAFVDDLKDLCDNLVE
jgi:hypothetical protein